jgi:hypothetical protein
MQQILHKSVSQSAGFFSWDSLMSDCSNVGNFVLQRNVLWVFVGKTCFQIEIGHHLQCGSVVRLRDVREW